LLAGVVVVLIAVFVFTLATHLRVLHRWRTKTRLLALPLVAAAGNRWLRPSSTATAAR
jgi:hypothetical protein